MHITVFSNHIKLVNVLWVSSDYNIYTQIC